MLVVWNCATKRPVKWDGMTLASSTGFVVVARGTSLATSCLPACKSHVFVYVFLWKQELGIILTSLKYSWKSTAVLSLQLRDLNVNEPMIRTSPFVSRKNNASVN